MSTIDEPDSKDSLIGTDEIENVRGRTKRLLTFLTHHVSSKYNSVPEIVDTRDIDQKMNESILDLESQAKWRLNSMDLDLHLDYEVEAKLTSNL